LRVVVHAFLLVPNERRDNKTNETRLDQLLSEKESKKKLCHNEGKGGGSSNYEETNNKKES